MLTPEGRHQVEEGQRKGPVTEARSGKAPRSGSGATPSIRLLAFGVVMLTGVVAFVSGCGTDQKEQAKEQPRAAVPKRTPEQRKIAKGPIAVQARGHVSYAIRIEPEMIEPVVAGEFRATGGSGNDIEAVMADEIGFNNWINGHAADILWSTRGKQTAGRFEIRPRPGEYYLVFSNKFSALSDKQVMVDIDLKYIRLETNR